MKRLDLRIALESPDQAEIRRFFAEADRYYNQLYPRESNQLPRAPELIDMQAEFMVARSSGQVRGFTAVLPRDHRAYYELKRLYVVPGYRRSGIGRCLMEEVLALLEPRRPVSLRLETGVKQHAAVSLFRAMGFEETVAFPPYPDDPNSWFFELRLA